jgi:hypothetical protein
MMQAVCEEAELLSRRAVRAVLLPILVLASIFPIDLFPPAPHDILGADGQYSGKQGQVLLIEVRAGYQAASAAGQFMGRTVPFFPDLAGRPGMLVGLLGIDMQDKPGLHELVVVVREPQGTRQLSYGILVLEEQYPIQHLTLPSEQVDLDQDQLLRVQTEQALVNTVLHHTTPERLWHSPFVEPLKGEVAGTFGRLRVINGQVRSPHSGEDIAAPLGTPVVAMNDGVVRLTADHFFAGKGVVVDHGLGLYSMYFHLSEILVRDGEAVKQGQVIGRVGATGRTTGPHLHLGVRLNGARVNPYSLIQLPLGGFRDGLREWP